MSAEKRSVSDDHDLCDEAYFEDTGEEMGNSVFSTAIAANPYVQWLESRVALDLDIEHKAELVYTDPEYDQDEGDDDDGIL